MFRYAPLSIALAATAAVAQPAPAGPAGVFKAYEAAVEAGDGAAIAALISDDPAPTPFSFCPPAQSNRDCLISYLNRTVVTTHSIINPVKVTVTGDTVDAKLELRNDLTRAAAVDRLAGTDRITVANGKIVAFAFVRDETDPQTQKFFAYMRSMMGAGGPPGGAPGGPLGGLPHGRPASLPPR